MENETKLRNFEPVAQKTRLESPSIVRNPPFKTWKEFSEFVEREESKIPESAIMTEFLEKHWP